MLFQGCLVETLVFSSLYTPDNRLTRCTANVLEKIGTVTGSRVHPGCLVGSVLFIFLALYVVLYFACLCSVTYAQYVPLLCCVCYELVKLTRPPLTDNKCYLIYMCQEYIRQLGRTSSFEILSFICLY
jgi:hypothetical protein